MQSKTDIIAIHLGVIISGLIRKLVFAYLSRNIAQLECIGIIKQTVSLRARLYNSHFLYDSPPCVISRGLVTSREYVYYLGTHNWTVSEPRNQVTPPKGF